MIPDRGYIRFDGQHFLLLPSRYGRNFFDLAVSYKVDVSVLKWIYGISSQIPAGGDEKWRSVDVVEGVKELQHPRLDGLMRPKIEAWKRDGYSITKNAKVTENAVVEVKKEKEEDVKWDAEEVDGRQEEMMEIRPINPQDVSSRKEPVVGSAAVAVAAPASVVPPSKLEMDIQSLMSIYSLAESLVQQELQQLFPVSGSSNDSTIFNNSPTTAMLYFNSLLDVAAVAAAATASQSTTSSSPVSSTLNNNINNKSSKKKKKKKKLKNRASSGKSFSGSTTQFTNENPALWNLVALPDNHISNIVKIITGANHLNSHIYTNCRIYARKEWESWSLFENLGHLVRVKPGAIPSFAFDNGLHVASVLEMAVGKSDLSDEGLNRLLSGFEDHVHVAWHEITQFCGIGDTMEYFSPFNDEYLPSTSSFLKLNLVISTSKFISLALEQGNQFGFPFAASGPHNEVAGKYWTSLESKIVWPKLCNIDSEDEVPMSDHLAVVSEAVKLVVLKWGSQELEINTSVTNDRLWKRFRAVLEWIMKKEMN